MTDEQLIDEVVRVVVIIDRMEPNWMVHALNRLTALGLKQNMHVGMEMRERTRRCVEWYGGQLLEAIENKKWHSISGIVQLCEQYTGRRADGRDKI